MCSRTERSLSIDHASPLENQRVTLPKTFHLNFHHTSVRLRHLTQIVGCNLERPKNIAQPPLPNILPSLKSYIKPGVGYYFTLESSSRSLPHFTSECHYSECPVWDSFDCNTVFPIHLLSLKAIIVQVWYKAEDEQRHLVTSWGVHFSGLVPLPTTSIYPQHYPPNTLIMKIRGYYYTSYDCFRETTKSTFPDGCKFGLQKGYSIPLSETKPSYSVPSLCRLHSTKRAIRQQEEKRERLREQLEYRGVKGSSSRMLLRNKVENMKIRVSLLTQHLVSEINKVKSIRSVAENLDIENQDKGIELLGGYQHLNRQLSVLRNQEEKLHEDFSVLRDIISKTKDRRTYLLSQLPIIFPVKNNSNSEDSNHYTICDVHLPDAESYSGLSEQSLSVALGYVAQLLVKIAQFINIPLKYPVTLRGSLSSIADLTSTQLQDVETQFPLYTRGKEREKLHFNYGVFLLNKNVAQLRWSCGLSTTDLRTTLVNVDNLLSSLQNNSQTQHRAIMPDTMVLQPILPVSLRFNARTSPSLPNSMKYSASLQDAPMSPRRNKESLCSDSDIGEPLPSSVAKLRANKSVSDFSPSDSETENKKEKFKKIIHGKVKHSKSLSYSLDKGLNCLTESKSVDMLVQTENLLPKLSSNFILASSGSYPDLTKNENVVIEDGVLSDFNDQTTELLKSWHEDNPTPYASISVVSGSIEKLEDAGLTSESPIKIIQQDSPDDGPEGRDNRESYVESSQDKSVTKEGAQPHQLVPQRTSESQVDYEVNKGDKNEINLKSDLPESKSNDNLQSKLYKEFGLSLADLGITDDSFLNEVTFRTAELASQNCSFNLSYSRQSPEAQ